MLNAQGTRLPGKSSLAVFYATVARLSAMIGGGKTQDIQAIWPTLGMPIARPQRLSPSFTKKGPGRIHKQGSGHAPR